MMRIFRIACGLLLLCGGLRAETTERVPFRGVRYVCCAQQQPEPLVYHAVWVDLRDPAVRFKTTPSNGNAPKDTRTQTTLDFIKENKAQLGVNGNWFTNDGDSNTDLLGLAVSEGALVSPWDVSGAEYAVNISRDNHLFFFKRPAPPLPQAPPDPSWHNALAGRYLLVQSAAALPKPGGERHPRTAIAATEKGDLLLLVVDGRQPRYSVGMTLYELAQTLLKLGARDALCLDGGGSATLALADPEPRVVNVPMPAMMPVTAEPIAPPGIQRANGNNLVIFAAPAPTGAEKQ